jgi:hypothetical protein
MFKFNIFFIIILMFSLINAEAQPANNDFLKQLLLKNPDSIFQQVLKESSKYRCQIIYTQINRDKNNRPTFKNYHLNLDSSNYFNPASMVKMPLAFLSLEKLNNMNVAGVNKFTPIIFDSSYPWTKGFR